MATITSLAPIEVPAREVAITLCLEIARECFKLQWEKPTIDPRDPAYNAWWVVRRTAETFKVNLSLNLTAKQLSELGQSLFTYHSLACPLKVIHFRDCRCEAASLIQRLNSVLEGGN